MKKKLNYKKLYQELKKHLHKQSFEAEQEYGNLNLKFIEFNDFIEELKRIVFDDFDEDDCIVSNDDLKKKIIKYKNYVQMEELKIPLRTQHLEEENTRLWYLMRVILRDQPLENEEYLIFGNTLKEYVSRTKTKHKRKIK